MTAPVNVLDYGVGNLKSLTNAITNLGVVCEIVTRPEELAKTTKLILPGVGAFGAGMQALHAGGFVEDLHKLRQRQIPILGICLGMQLMFEASDESPGVAGFGWLAGKVRPIPSFDQDGVPQKIPHMGWNDLHIHNRKCQLVQDLTDMADVYFVHSYYVDLPTSDEALVASTEYGGHSLTALVQKQNLYGCQFHPEKSGEMGLKILRNFLKV